MGIKSKRLLFNQSINNPFKVGGLIFDCKNDFIMFKNLDEKIGELNNSGNDNDYNYLFSDVKIINVTETYPDAREEMDELFGNASILLVNENTRFNADYKIGCRFFSMINVINFEEYI